MFLLYKDELRDAVRGAGGDLTATVAQRRGEDGRSGRRWCRRSISATRRHTTTTRSSSPIVDKMLGLLPVEPSTDPDVITGVAASPGTVQGTAKVVRSLTEASKLQHGDIMVCEMTVPTWVPLFATVSAVVADSGGILSHCAIVAREFRLPASSALASGRS